MLIDYDAREVYGLEQDDFATMQEMNEELARLDELNKLNTPEMSLGMGCEYC